MSDAEGKSTFVYVTYIRTTPEKLWRALIEPEFTRQFWAGTWQECEWKQGAPWRIMIPDGRVGDNGEVLEIEPNKRLVLSWRNEFKPELRAEGFSRLTYSLEPDGDMVKLTVRHEIDRPQSKLIEAVSGGWPLILASLKSLLETGESLRGDAEVAGARVMDTSQFKPKTVYVTYIAASPQQVWDALTLPEFTKEYFFARTIEIEPKQGGAFILRMPDGRVDVKGIVAEWSPPHRLSVTWTVDWIEDMRNLPECLVTYEIAQAGESVRLTMTEAHQWDVPDDLLSGGRAGWPAILSSLKSVLETGKPLSLKMEPPKEMMAALERMKRK